MFDFTSSFEEKNTIIKNGKPTPILNLTTKIKICIRHFYKSIYKTSEWIAGCKFSGKMYCWLCMLFSNKRNVWTTTGFSDLNNLSKAIKRHCTAASGKHLTVIQLKTFGLNRIKNAIDNSRTIAIAQHNSKVKFNREIMKNYIDAVYFLSTQELAFRGNDESANSLNRGNYIEMIYFLAE